MSETLSTVVAGSKGFVDAVQGHLKLRFGAAPRVASDPAETLRVCADGGGLLVLEYAGSPWLEAVKSLRGACGDAALSIVAAVPLAQAADVRPLQRAGVDEVVSWQGRVDPVMWAVDRIVGRQSARPAGLPVPELPDEGLLEKGLLEKGVEVREVSDQPGSTDAHADPEVPVLSRPATTVASELRPPVLSVAPAPAVPWPDAVPSAAAAEALLLAASAGRGAGDAGVLAAAKRVLASASELERAALAGADVSVEPALLRTIAGLRLRLDLALTTVPAAGGAADQPAAQQLLAEVDGVLEQLKALAAAAPAGVAPALEPMRLAIVDGGVKLAGALSGLVPAAQPTAAPPAVSKPSVRILSNEQVRPESGARVRGGMLAALALAALVAGGYHLWSWTSRPAPQPLPRMAGAPAGLVLYATPASSVRVLVLEDGRRLDPADLERFRKDQELVGMAVVQVNPHTLVVKPMTDRASGKDAK
jgi:hypothetical protein